MNNVHKPAPDQARMASGGDRSWFRRSSGDLVADRLLAASFAPLNKAERQQLQALLAKLLCDDAARG